MSSGVAHSGDNEPPSIQNQNNQPEIRPEIPRFPSKPPIPCVAANVSASNDLVFACSAADTRRTHGNGGADSASAAAAAQNGSGGTHAAFPAASNKSDGVFLKRSGEALAQEDDEGAVEYKWRLVGISEKRLQHLSTQMKFRVAEGRGECLYEVGVEDDGFPRGLPASEFDESIATLRTMAARLGFTLDVNCVVSKPNPHDPTQVLRCAEVRVRKIVQTLPTCRIAVIGDTNSGKSTLVGVIASGALDDGSGTVRQSVFNHKHELESGQTSSVCDRVVGFSRDGKIVNYEGTATTASNGNTDVESAKAPGVGEAQSAERNASDAITERSATLTMLIDLPGHLKRSHTALSAIVGRFPHVVALVVNPAEPDNAHIHIAQCAALQLPFFLIFTHQDSAQPQTLGHAATVVDRSVGAETGKRLVMVSAPIYPGEDDGGFQSRGMIHTSSDMFLSDLCSTDGGGSQMGGKSKSGMNGGGSPGGEDRSDGGDFDDDNDAVDGDGVGGVSGNPSPPSLLNTPGRPSMKTPSATRPFNLGGAASRNPVEAYLSGHVPVFIVSSVTGYGIPLLKHFLHQLSLTPPRLTVDECEPMPATFFPSAPPSPKPAGAPGAAAAAAASNDADPSSSNQTIRFVIDKVYTVAKVGLVAAGTVTSGTLRVGQNLYWGPSRTGNFFPVCVASLHYQRNFVRSVGSGNECAVAFDRSTAAPDNEHLLAMAQRRGTMLYGSELGTLLPPATSRDFRVLVSKAQAVQSAQDWKVDQELTAFVFTAKQAAFLRKIEPVDFSSQEYAAVRPARTPGDAARPLILHCSFVVCPEVLAVGAPIVLLRNTPDGRLGAVAGRILSFDACTRGARESESSSESRTPPRSPTNGGSPVTVNPGGRGRARAGSGKNTTPPTPTTVGTGGLPAAARQQQQQFPQHADPASSSSHETAAVTGTASSQVTSREGTLVDSGMTHQNSAQFPLVADIIQTMGGPSGSNLGGGGASSSSSMMKRPTTSSPPLTPTTNPPVHKASGTGMTILDLARHQEETSAKSASSSSELCATAADDTAAASDTAAGAANAGGGKKQGKSNPATPVLGAQNAADLAVAKERAERKKAAAAAAAAKTASEPAKSDE